jgi:hypothetical protein
MECATCEKDFELVDELTECELCGKYFCATCKSFDICIDCEEKARHMDMLE